MSSGGFYYSPELRCPDCGERVHPGLVGDMRAHARASGVAVHFGCGECGTMLQVGGARGKAVQMKEKRHA